MAAVTSAVAAVGGVAMAAKGQKDAKKAQKAAMSQQQEAMDLQYDIANRQQEMAEEQWARYKEQYQPLEDAYIQEAKGLGSIANQERAATEARADVAGAFGRAREQLNKAPGSNPTSQTYQQEVNRLNLAEAASSAASQTAARRTEVDKGRAAISDAINMGKGLPSSAASGLSGSAASAGGASSVANSMYGNATASGKQTMDAIGGFASAMGGLAKNPTVQGWGSSLSNWWSGGSGGLTAPNNSAVNTYVDMPVMVG